VRTLKFLAIVLTALALVPLGAHLFVLPNKILLAESNYFIVQNIYRGWALFGIVLFGALFANLALAWALRGQRFFFRYDLPRLPGREPGHFFRLHVSGQPGDQQLDRGSGRLAAAALAVGGVARAEYLDRLRRLLLAGDFAADGGEVTTTSAHSRQSGNPETITKSAIGVLDPAFAGVSGVWEILAR
jgi:hypothetical protein